MIGIDSNILVRLFVEDDREQADPAVELFAKSGPRSIRVSQVVMAETVWALRRSYGRDKTSVVAALVLLFGREELVFESRSTLLTALGRYQRGNADFADYLIAASNIDAGAVPTFTFDRKTSTQPGLARLPTRTN